MTLQTTETDTLTITPPWRLHADASTILMSLYPDIDAISGQITDTLPADHHAVQAVKNCGRAYLAAVGSLMELVALHESGAIGPDYYRELGEGFERLVRQEMQQDAKALVIDLPQRKGGRFSMRRGLRGSTLLELVTKAIG
jgi:hypothetical protein